MGQDTYWLDAVARSAGQEIAIVRVECSEGFPDCLDQMPRSEQGALLLVEAALHVDLVDLVRELRTRGWQHVVVVAANPNISEARAVLRNGTAFDYWAKSYECPVIRQHLEQNQRELWGMDDEQSDEPDRR